MREHSRIFKMITLITQVGITMLSSIFISGLVGYLIDKHFGTQTFLVFLVIGIIGGYKAVYKVIKQFLATEPKTENKSYSQPQDLWKEDEESGDDPS